MNKLHVIQHASFDAPAHIGRWAQTRGLALETVPLFAGATPPDANDVEALVIMGGPMSVYDDARFPWLAQEKRLVEQMVRADKPVLGVCLGAQIVANVLGARVRRNRFQEIGWFPLEATADGCAHDRFALPARFDAFHWHGETFDLPAGASHLARSVACENQVFAYGAHVLALQFHLEMTPEAIEDMITNCAGELGSGPYVQSPEQMRAAVGHTVAAQALLETLLDLWKENRDEDPT